MQFHTWVTPCDLHLHFPLQSHQAPCLRCLTERNFSQTTQNKPSTSSGVVSSPSPPVLPAPKHDTVLVCLGFLHSSRFHPSLERWKAANSSCNWHPVHEGISRSGADTLPQWLLLSSLSPAQQRDPFPQSSPHQAFPTQLWAVHGPQPSQPLQPSRCRRTEMLSLMAVSSGRGLCESCSTARAGLLLSFSSDKSFWMHLRHLWL